ncbi:HAD family hydrolase [Nocardioides iriomotensis]|uniref:HAD family phosphatase n=1 Tax=Nocardioides iriomotensis TaxID=715784 RepID=A0A4Q5IZE6_9ACTN|nr:HAD family phosphatase [Nocardioides iriomotensis]RYU11590.1 HAD family phosphatase [Nocardioides iriomotensis]
MVVRAVVMDLGDVLERVGDDAWPTRWAERWAGEAGLDLDGLDTALARHEPVGDLVTGAASEADFRTAYAAALGLSDEQAAAMMAEMWDGYCGELDVPLHEFWLSLRERGVRLGILSNSMDGARREEGRRYGFPDQVDVLVYSHEVGLAKPDPAIYALTTERLGVRPDEVAFLDDSATNVAAAQTHGWHAMVHDNTHQSIAWLRELLDGEA